MGSKIEQVCNFCHCVVCPISQEKKWKIYTLRSEHFCEAMFRKLREPAVKKNNHHRSERTVQQHKTCGKSYFSLNWITKVRKEYSSPCGEMKTITKIKAIYNAAYTYLVCICNRMESCKGANARRKTKISSQRSDAVFIIAYLNMFSF